MIQWLLQSHHNIDEPPELFLSATELCKFKAFVFDKRRRDWLVGRWTAKRLLQALVFEQDAELIVPTAIEILNDADGAPSAAWHTRPLGYRFSISHSNGYALCAGFADGPGHAPELQLGVDLELVEPRADSFVRDYFTANEQARVDATASVWRDMVVTLLWSAKEAVVKARRRGLRVDTRAVEISIAPVEHPPALWSPFDVAFSGSDLEGPPLYGWWRAQEGFVMTLTATTLAAPSECPVRLPSFELLGVNDDQGYASLSRRIARAPRHHARHPARD